jgi:hypothetical protein
MKEDLLIQVAIIATPLTMIIGGMIYDAVRVMRREQRAASQGRHPSRKRG